MMTGWFPLTEREGGGGEKGNTAQANIQQSCWAEKQNGRPPPAQWRQQMVAAGSSHQKPVALSKHREEHDRHKMSGALCQLSIKTDAFLQFEKKKKT